MPSQRVGERLNPRNPALPESLEGSFEVGEHAFTELPACPVGRLSQQGMASGQQPLPEID